jgi:O-antigen/teichoic acid export membrane protein
VGIVYGSDFVFTAFYLKLYLVAFLFSGLGNFSVNNLFNGIGETRQSFNTNLLALLVGAPMALLLIPRFGVVGLLFTMVVAPRVRLFYGLWWIKKTFGFSVEMRSSVMIYASAFAAYIAGFAVMSLVGLGGWVTLIVVGVVFALVYLLMLPLSGALTVFDLREFGALSRGLGPLAPLGAAFVRVMGRLMRRRGT